MSKKLSIVIPVFNKWNFTKSCLNDLSQLPNDHEIVVIDNGSTDETSKNLKDSKDIRYVSLGKNNGFAKGCNAGYLYSSGDNILFLNNDIRVKSNHSNWTKVILDKCDNAIVGPTMGQLDKDLNFIQESNKILSGNSYISGWCIASSRKIWDQLDFKRPGEDVDVTSDTPVPVPHFPQIFSEEFGLAYFEDTDLSFRAKKLGLRFEIVDIPVVHFGKQTSKQLNTYQLYKNARKIFIKKWGK